jgi:endonuclease YncB( thermonuclease family)
MKFPKRAFLASAVAMVLVTGHGSQASATDLQQDAVVRIVDGDTLAVDGMPERIRLYGIDAPEDGQSCFDQQRAEYDCGTLATAALRELLGHGDVWCEFKRTGRGTVRHDIYGRILAVCGAGKVDANDWLVRQGFAWSCRKMKAYKAAEAEARSAERGVWSGENLQPWEWRKQVK